MTACLGGPDQYRAQIVTRPFPDRPSVVWADFPVAACTWTRKLNDISDATVDVPANPDCCGKLKEMANMFSLALFELHLYRDPDGLVWAGRVTELSEDPSLSADADTVTIAARGMLSWSEVRVFAAPMPYTVGGPGQPTWTNTDVATIFEDWFLYLMSKDDPNPGLVVNPSGVLSTRSVVLSEAANGWTKLKDVIDGGCDVVEYGRVIYAGDLAAVIPRLLTITAEWFADPPGTRVSSLDQANKVWGVGGSGVLGSAGGPDPATGLLLETSLSDSGLTTLAAANAFAAAERAERWQALAFVEGTNSLSPGAPVNIQQLIPGARTAVDLYARCASVLSDMVLTDVSVSYSPTSDSTEQIEKVSVTFEQYEVAA